MAFLLDRLRDSFGEDAEEVDFGDMNYKVGNTSGMDVTAQIPSEIAERVGQLAQRSGGEMEIQIENPSSFFVDRENLYSVVNGLDIDISIHSDPNVGYTSPYQVGEGGGFDGTHNYFTKYLESFTSFKLEAEAREDLKFGKEGSLKIGRINPHISVSPLPQIEQERAQGVGLDPFGYTISDLKEENFNERTESSENIYKNPEFLRRFYRLFILNELGDDEYRYFDRLYSTFSNKFDREWRKRQNKILNEIYENRTGSNGSSRIEEKIDIVSTASIRENVTTRWLEILSDEDLAGFEPLENPMPGHGSENIETLGDLNEFISSLSQRYRFSQLRTLPEIYYYIKNENPSQLVTQQLRDDFERAIDDDFREGLKERVEKALPQALDKLWFEEAEDDDLKISRVSVQSKLQAVVRELEIPETRVPEKAFEVYGDELRSIIEDMFAGEDLDLFEERGEDSEEEKRRRHRKFIQSFSRQFEQQMWQESNLFYRIIPAWLSVAHKSFAGHKGWQGPKFLWEILVRRKWGDKENVDLDLTNPQSENGDDTKRYFDLLEESRECQMDVAAAVAGTYMWSMFTQVEGRFEMDAENSYFDSNYGNYTWIEWMNKYGIGVNMETMAGNPRQFFKLWRPIHAVAACRAINITARNTLKSEGELGGREEMAPELDECPVKFTIDMEHVSSFGVDPIKEMRLMRDQEKELLENPIEIDGEEIYTPGDPEKHLAKMLRMYHLTKPGHETSGGVGHTHGPVRKGNKELYSWLFDMVKWGFTRTGEDGERASVMYEVGGEQVGTVYQAKLAMDLIELGVSPEELDPNAVDPGEEPESEREALIARFYGIERSSYNREWAKIEEHAFDPLKGLLEAEEFDFTYSGNAAIEQGGNRPNEWKEEEYK